MSHHNKRRSILPGVSNFVVVRAALPVWEGISIHLLRNMAQTFKELRGTPQNQMDWKDPDTWIEQRLEGEPREWALKTWIETDRQLNPRFFDGPWALIRKYKLLKPDASGILRLTDSGRAFLADPTGPLAQQIDEAEGIFTIFLLIRRGVARYGEILRPWTVFLLRETTFSGKGIIRTSLSRRLKNLVARGCLERNGRQYSLTESGLAYLEQSEYAADDSWIDSLLEADPSELEPDPDPDDGTMSDISSYVEEFLPDELTRRRVLELLAESIEEAHEINPSSWALSFRADVRCRLNVGRTLVFDLSPDPGTVWVGFYDPERIAGLDPAEKRPDLQLFTSLAGVVLLRYDVDDLLASWSDVRERHLESVRRAASAVRRTPYYPSHTPSAVDYLNEELDAELPQPSFGETRVAATDPYSLTELSADPGFEIYAPYSLEDFADDSGFKLVELERWVRAIHRKKQAVFYGPPGTGKTFVAERLARHLVGGTTGFAELVQFHPAYAYEDFIQGLRPVEDGTGAMPRFRLQPGRFLDFCHRAGETGDLCVLILDEINRANLSRVFGELMYLLEYRNKTVPLAGGGTLRIPENVRILGTMNTADRSIALVDHALRRRFAFVPLRPNYEVLRRFHEGEKTAYSVEPLIDLLKKLNGRIGDSHYEVGISFFLRRELGAEIEDIWRMEIESYLEEYFCDQPDALDEYRWENVGERLSP